MWGGWLDGLVSITYILAYIGFTTLYGELLHQIKL